MMFEKFEKIIANNANAKGINDKIGKNKTNPSFFFILKLREKPQYIPLKKLKITIPYQIVKFISSKLNKSKKKNLFINGKPNGNKPKIPIIIGMNFNFEFIIFLYT